ncbi:MDR family NADP-dependent oxidoreductase [Nocardioides pantholopis]|uniref:MDR family NADP-dependent oxidoreductase n=1 Tax=Nocardioides pantholopis TaxID=2483798 RepID=UPI0013DDF7E5|nr:NADP-dependent oxidoreductase [Nocardioides pantholopis]
MATTRAVVLARIPEGAPRPEDFALATLPVAEPAEGQVTVQVQALSLDPYIRSTLGGRHLGDAPVGVGDLIPGRAIATVVDSPDGALPAGTLVLAETGWRECAVVPVSGATVVTVPDGVPATAALGALGMPGLTAYAAHERHLRPRLGDTVVISSATGGVGAVAGQLARLAGARAVAIVGSEAKAAMAVEHLGYAAAVVRGADGWAERLREACPDRIDGYLHMGDQTTLDVVAEQLAVGARVSLCGLMDQYNNGAPTTMRAGAIMAARAEVHGMVVYDHHDLAAKHAARVGVLIASGDLTLHEDRYVGLDRAPEAFARLMSGQNNGKVVVQVGD